MRIVWSSFHGRFSDSPRALFERLQGIEGLEHVWLSHHDFAAGFPTEVTRVDVDGPDAREALEAADLVVACSHVEVEWDKPVGATYLQTWHGTPLKRVHRDVLWAPDGVLDRLDRDIAKWDLLLSPNAASTPRLRQAFGWTGPVLETGYPRNDVLAQPRHDVVRERVRQHFGVRREQVAVLYAPTWRDRQGYGSTEEVPSMLDAGVFGELAPRHVLLSRAHNMVSGRLLTGQRDWVRDASYHPDIAELYAAADVLVTDYSSAMFDFAVTGRPILFLAPDLEDYRDRTRGFYYDPTDERPGPLLRTTEELVDAVGSLDDVRAEYAATYAAFQARYTYLEDGHAGERVLAHLGLA